MNQQRVELFITFVIATMVGVTLQARCNAPADDHRLERHCTFERMYLEQLQGDLRSANRTTQMAGQVTFQMLAAANFREAAICAPQDAPLDPGDHALLCSITNDVACMRGVIANALLYVRGS